MVVNRAILYDRIGEDYRSGRREDPRIGAAILAALAGASPVLNAGAGAGSYEPSDRPVVAAEPSAVMLAQRPAGAGPGGGRRGSCGPGAGRGGRRPCEPRRSGCRSPTVPSAPRWACSPCTTGATG